MTMRFGSKIEDLNTIVKSLKGRLPFVEIDSDFVNDKQKNLNERLTHNETNCKYVDERINHFKAVWKKVRMKLMNVTRKLFIQRFIAEAKIKNSKELQKLPNSKREQC